MTMQGKAVLVTGGSRGIGRAVAIELGRRGATVAVHWHQREDAAAEVVDTVRAGSRDARAFAVGADLGDPDAPARLIEAVRAELASNAAEPVLHGLVLNAGTLVAGGLADVTAAAFDRAFAVNTRAPLLLVQAALPLLRRGSRVIAVSAAITRQANPALLLQTASKAALEDLTRNLAVELGARGIGVVAVTPGVVRTDLAAGLLAAPAGVETVEKETALARVGEPDDVAAAIAALLEPDTRWITGTTVDVSGGYRL
jgi:3-oxoacyl-[acyl-carrier protein] reductase